MKSAPLIILLVVLLLAGGVAAYVFRAKLFGPAAVATAPVNGLAGTPSAPKKKKKKKAGFNIGKLIFPF